MKTLQRITIGMMLLATALSCGNSSEQKELICSSVEQHLTQYPEATLCDLYKSFFQDRFGPGHLIADTSAANQYLLSELESCDVQSDILYEPTLYQGNFYRVDLSVVKGGRLAYQTFFDAFVRSANAVEPMSVEEWKKEWQIILSAIETMDIELKNFQQDKQAIDLLLQSGKYAIHHSREFVQAYDPHYRIVEKKIFEQEILPLLAE